MARMPVTECVSPLANRPRGFARTCLVLLAVVSLLLGLAMAGRGTWLLALGGSFHELLAGAAVSAAAAAILVGRAGAGVGLFAVVVAATGVLSFAEVHAKGWMPAGDIDFAVLLGMLLGLLVLLVLALALLRPRRAFAAGRSQLVALGVTLVLVGGAAVSTSLLVDDDSVVVFALPPHAN